jgi:hypothetical protein
MKVRVVRWSCTETPLMEGPSMPRRVDNGAAETFLDEALDEALDESFPASDPLSFWSGRDLRAAPVGSEADDLASPKAG